MSQPAPLDRDRGNTHWVRCPQCHRDFPVGPSLLAPKAPPACCPACHHAFVPEESPR